MKPVDQSRLIRKLLREQDSVLEQLDQLNDRVEQALRHLQPSSAAEPVPVADASAA